MTITKIVLIVCVFGSNIGYAQRSDFADINFYTADSVATIYKGHTLKHPDILAQLLTKDLSSDVEKFRAIFYWITQNISYDYPLFQKMEKKSKKLAYKRAKLLAWNKKLNRKSLARTVRKRKAVCSGYAALLESMSVSIGISCKSISGYARTLDFEKAKRINHAWNAVNLNNKWYLCDATWASGSVKRSNNRDYQKFNKDYFLTDPTLLIANHFPQDSTWTLLYNKPTLIEFLDAPLKTDGYLRNKINTYYPEKGIVRIKQCEVVKFSFTCNVPEVYSVQLHDKYLKQTSYYNYRPYKNNQGRYTLEFMFEEKGSHFASIIINDNATFLYQIYVR